jgi:hypothetical protein
MAYQPQYPNTVEPSVSNINLPQAPSQPTSLVDSALNKALYATGQDMSLSTNRFLQPLKVDLIPTLRYDSADIGYNPFDQNLENKYAEEQGVIKYVGSNLAKTVGDFGGAFINSIAFIPTAVGSLATGNGLDWLKDNELSNSINDWSDSLDQMLPTYKTHYQEDNPFLSTFTSFRGFSDFTRIIGYTAGALVGASVAASLTGGAGLTSLAQVPLNISRIASSSGRFLSGGSKALNLFNESVAAGKTLPKAILDGAKAIKAIDKLKYEFIMFNSAGAEAMMETTRGYGSTMSRLKEDYRNKYNLEPTKAEIEQMEELAQSAHNAQFLGNMALLYTTNKLTFGEFFKPTSVVKNEITKDIGGKLSLKVSKENLNLVEAVVKEPKTGFKGFIQKGRGVTQTVGKALWKNAPEAIEEGVQYGLETGVTDYATRKYNKDDILFVDNLWKSSATGVKSALFTEEGQQGMFYGLLLGGVVGGLKSMRRRKSGAANDAQIAAQTVSELNAYNPASLFNIKHEEAVVGTSLKNSMRDALENDDMFRYRNLKHQALFNYVNAGLKSGHFDLQQDRLKMAKELEGEAFQEMFGYEFTNSNRRTANEYIDKIVAETEIIKTNIENVDTIFKNPHNPNKEPIKYKIYEDYKDSLKLSLSEIKDKKKRIDQLKSELSDTYPNLSPNDALHFTNNVGYLTKMQEISDRISELKELERETSTSKILSKDFETEREFLEKQWELLNEGKEKPEPKHLKDIFNYYTNGKKVPQSGLESLNDDDISNIYNTAYDIEKLSIGAELGTVAYNYLRNGESYLDFQDKIMSRMNSLDKSVKELPDGTMVVDDDEKIKQQDKEVREAIKEKKIIAEAENLIEAIESDPTLKKEGTTKADIEKLIQIAKKEEAGTPLTEEEKDVKEEKPKSYEAVKVAKDIVEEEDTKKADKKAADEEDINTPTEEELKAQEDLFEDIRSTGPQQKGNIENPVSINPDTNTNIKGGELDIRTVLTKAYTAAWDNQTENLWDYMFKRQRRGFADTIKIGVSKSTKGRSEKDKNPIVPGKNIYKSGYATDVVIYDGTKPMGYMVPANSLFFKRGTELLPFIQITEEEFLESFPNTDYNSFMATLNSYTTMWNELMNKVDKDIYEGEKETLFTGKSLQPLFRIKPIYGSQHTHTDNTITNTIGDLKYQNRGSAIISIPGGWDFKSQKPIRIGTPFVVEESRYTKDELNDIYNHINSPSFQKLSNILNSRYLYLDKLPNGKFTIFRARPITQIEGDKKKIFEVLKTGTPAEFMTLMGSTYITDSRKTHSGTSIKFSMIEDGSTLQLKVINSTVRANPVYFDIFISRDEIGEMGNLNDLVAVVNQKINEIKQDKLNSQAVAATLLNVRLQESDFRVNILNDDSAKFDKLKTQLTVPTYKYQYRYFGMEIVPTNSGNITPDTNNDVEQTEETEEPKAPTEAFTATKIMEYMEVINKLKSMNTKDSLKKAKELDERLDKTTDEYKKAEFIHKKFDNIIEQLKGLGSNGQVQVKC